MPWVIIGDLNELSSSKDKLAKNKENSSRLNKFNNLLNKNKLIDIGHIRLPFTWWNSRLKDNTILLDRVVANPAWTNVFKKAWVENIPIVGSDHGPILLPMENPLQPKKFSPFRFEAKWLLQESFHQVVRKSWNSVSNGSAAFQLARKTELLKKEIREWKKECFNNEHKTIDKLTSDLKKDQLDVMSNTNVYAISNNLLLVKSQLERSFI